MPGTVTSIPKSGWPVTILALSTPDVGLPAILCSAMGLSRTDAMSGADMVAAVAASWP
jgi:hypothetical protein